jgi:hypothetical protein
LHRLAEVELLAHEGRVGCTSGFGTERRELVIVARRFTVGRGDLNALVGCLVGGFGWMGNTLFDRGGRLEVGGAG